MLAKEELVQVVNTAFDSARAALEVRTDEALAERLEVSAKTISFWRNGRWTTADEALINVLVFSLRMSKMSLPTSIDNVTYA